MILPVLEFPDIRLRKVSKPVKKITDELKQLAKDMLATMYSMGGIGLAAPQVGRLVRLIVVDTGTHGSIVLFNPILKSLEGEISSIEGCLSVPNFSGEVKRANKIVVQGLNIDNEEVEIEVDGLTAVCIQHEIDHLDGKLFIDHTAPLNTGNHVPRI